MIEHLPHWINVLFLVTCLAAVLLFHYSNGKPLKITLSILFWSVVQSAMAYAGFYQNTTAMPPRFGLVILPVTLFIILGLRKKPMNWVYEHRNRRLSTLLHAMRLPVEIVLFQLFVYNMVPELMTFEGRNFDILAGITSPVIALLYSRKK